jgi:hypothetical protein
MGTLATSPLLAWEEQVAAGRAEVLRSCGRW